jgi:hypothetical protein
LLRLRRSGRQSGREGCECHQGSCPRDNKDASGLLNAVSEKGPPEEIAAFRRQFGEVLEGLQKTLVVFIDNLDRCLPENAIHTLEAVRLFLFMPNTAFVIGADEDMIRHAVAHHFKDPGAKQVTDYLDELIQIPVRVPRAGVEEVRAYLFLLLGTRQFQIPRLKRASSKFGPQAPAAAATLGIAVPSSLQFSQTRQLNDCATGLFTRWHSLRHR